MIFGDAITAARKASGMSQKDLAGLIVKEDNKECISPQYLNDIEHGRRNPTSDHIIRQFARVLDDDEGYLFVLAGKIPDDLRQNLRSKEYVISAFSIFRKDATMKARKARAAEYAAKGGE